MNILYTTDFHNRANSGVTFSLNELAGQTLARVLPKGSVKLLSIGETETAWHPGVRHIADGVGHISAKSSTGPAALWRFAPVYSRLCKETILRNDISLVHIHGLWMHPQFAAARSAQSLAIPTVLTNHGAVQWAMRQPNIVGRAKKRLYMTLMKDTLFRKIVVQHAITQRDRDALYSFFPHNRIEVVPNFVDLQVIDQTLEGASVRGSEPYVLFVGRLHPTKGIDMLIEAFGRASVPRDWRLIIVGPTVDEPYTRQLHRLIAASARSDRIELRGPVWDFTAKYHLMRDAWLTVVPSHTEVISLVNLEASACCSPTITTKATGLMDWTEGGGMLVEPAVEPLAAALSEAVKWSDQERKQRGFASRRLIEKRYSATAVMPRWLDLYRSLH